MLAKIRHVESGDAYDVAQTPVWRDGLWDCGDRSFVDPDGTEYAVEESVKALLTPMQFYLAFTAQERMEIKASADLLVREFWDTFSLALQTNTPIEPQLVSVTGGLAYLRSVDILKSDDRIDQILAGVAQ